MAPIDFVEVIKEFTLLIEADHEKGTKKSSDSSIEDENVVVDALHVIHSHTLENTEKTN